MGTGPVLALDLATCTGVCLGAGDVLPSVWHHRLPKTGEDVGRFLSLHRKWLIGTIQQQEPTLVVFEAPILPARTNLNTTRKLQGLAGVTEMVAHDLGLDCREVRVSDVKQALSGYGNATKADMIHVARQYGLEPQVDDEADAFAVWLCAIRRMRPQHAHEWDLITRRRA